MEEPEKMHLFGDKREAGIKDAVITPCLVPPCKGCAAIENHLDSGVFPQVIREWEDLTTQ